MRLRQARLTLILLGLLSTAAVAACGSSTSASPGPMMRGTTGNGVPGPGGGMMNGGPGYQAAGGEVAAEAEHVCPAAEL